MSIRCWVEIFVRNESRFQRYAFLGFRESWGAAPGSGLNAAPLALTHTPAKSLNRIRVYSCDSREEKNLRMIRVICDIRGLTLRSQIFAFVNRGDFLFWLNRGLRGSNGFNSPQGYKCAERQDRINKMQTKKLLKLARLPVRSALPIAAFTLITRTAPCLRQLPSCVAVYPRDTRSRRVLSRKSFSSILFILSKPP